MLFNSTIFLGFLLVVFTLYWSLNKWNIRVQNGLILLASYFFYGCWDPRFLILIAISTFIDYSVGLKIKSSSQKAHKKRWLYVSIFSNIGLLFYFKYFNFFIESFVQMFATFGISLQYESLSIILPVGISFYTFQTLSYSIDIYQNRLQPTKNFLAFASFVSFFPQLVAGPIEKARDLLPQFLGKRSFDYGFATAGLKLILWGLFKKVVVADNCAKIVNVVFENPEIYSGKTLLVGAVFFSFQIYCDFSGYSDMATGIARLFGFNLKVNFNFPYFSKNLIVFWKRWHISLTTWFRDYLYIPLGGNRVSRTITLVNIIIVFLLSGLWHGANWTYVIWGGLNALVYILTSQFLSVFSINIKRFSHQFNFIKIVANFMIVTILWIFFRSESVDLAFLYFKTLFSPTLLNHINHNLVDGIRVTSVLIVIMIILEWTGRNSRYAILIVNNIKLKAVRWLVYGFVLVLIGLFMVPEKIDFLYFQF